MTQVLAWPPFKVGLGEPMRREQIAERCAVALSSVDQARRRTRAGMARVRFPEPDGYGIPPGGSRPVAYWYERTVKAYGVEVGWLNEQGQPARVKK